MGLKEGRIRIAEFGTGVDELPKNDRRYRFISFEKLQEWGDAIAGGGEKGQAAMSEVSTALATIEDATLRNKLAHVFSATLGGARRKNHNNFRRCKLIKQEN